MTRRARRWGTLAGTVTIAVGILFFAQPRPVHVLGPDPTTRALPSDDYGPALRGPSPGDPRTAVARPAAGADRDPPSPTEVAVEGVLLETLAHTPLPSVVIALVSGGSAGDASSEMATDAAGRFRFVEAADPPRAAWFRVSDPAWALVDWDVEGENGRALLPAGGRTAKVTLWVTKVFALRGRVVDEDGRPVEGAGVDFVVPMPMPGASGVTRHFGESMVHTDAAGRFLARGFAEDPSIHSTLTIVDERYAKLRVDPRSIPLGGRDDVRLVLSRGVTLAGVVRDAEGRPVSDAVVTAEFGGGNEVLHRSVRTDSKGRWALEHLVAQPLTLVARAFDEDAKGRSAIADPVDDPQVALIVRPIVLSRQPVATKVLGVFVVDVDEEIRAAYDLRPDAHVMVWDPGSYAERGLPGHLEKGYAVRSVRESPLESVRDFLERLLAERDRPEVTRTVTYEHHDEAGLVRSGDSFPLDEDRLAEIRATLARLKR